MQRDAEAQMGDTNGRGPSLLLTHFVKVSGDTQNHGAKGFWLNLQW